MKKKTIYEGAKICPDKNDDAGQNKEEPLVINVRSTIPEWENEIKISLWDKIKNFFKKIFGKKKKETINKENFRERSTNLVLLFNFENLSDRVLENVEILAPERFVDMKNPNEIRTKDSVLTYVLPNVSLRDAYMKLCFSAQQISKIRIIATEEMLKEDKNDGTIINIESRDIFGLSINRPLFVKVKDGQFIKSMADIDFGFLAGLMASFKINRVFPKTKVTVIMYLLNSLHF